MTATNPESAAGSGARDARAPVIAPDQGSAAQPEKRVCSRCIYDASVAGIQFDADGICNYCRQVVQLIEDYGTGTEKGRRLLDALISEMKAAGRGREFDCIVGVSGGTDSSYLLMRCVDWGLRPLAVHYDNTWDSSVATENIRKITAALGVKLHTYVIDNKEADDIFRSALRAGVPEWDASTDIAFVQVLRAAAAKYRCRYILEGHSFLAEGVSPLGSNYFDGRYVADIHAKYGTGRLRTFPNLTFWSFMKWLLLYRQKFIRPLWYISYSKQVAREELVRRTGWQYYGGHHLENLAAVFGHTVYLPQRFGVDFRNLSLAAAVRAGLLDRQEAIRTYSVPVEPDPAIVPYVKKRLGLTDVEYARLMHGPKRTFRDFKTYKRRFERLRPLFFLLAKANVVPMSFYLKYCFPMRAPQ
jgi:hypothetical protein